MNPGPLHPRSRSAAHQPAGVFIATVAGADIYHGRVVNGPHYVEAVFGAAAEHYSWCYEGFVYWYPSGLDAATCLPEEARLFAQALLALHQ